MQDRPWAEARHLRQTPLWDLFEAVWRHSQGTGSSPAASAWPARAAGNGARPSRRSWVRQTGPRVGSGPIWGRSV